MLAVWLAARDPQVPRSAKIVAAVTAAYALSPIDLIPDFVPVLGYLDDLVLVPFGIWLVIRLVPPQVMARLRAEAAAHIAEKPPSSRLGAIAVLATWALVAALLLWLVFWRRGA